MGNDHFRESKLMKTRISIMLFMVPLILVAFSGGYLFGQSANAPVTLFDSESASDAAVPSSAPFGEVWELIHTRYFDQPVDDTLLTEAAIDGMLAALDDPHTRYLSPEDEALARERLAGEFQGIGVEVEVVEGEIVVVSPIDGSPAAIAGLRPGDIIRQAQGVELTGKDLQDVVDLVRGPAGTPVTLVIERFDQLFEIEVVRDVIKSASVRGELLDEGIAYVRVSQFGDRTAIEMEETLTELLAQDPIGLILDLRRNPGGGLETVVDVADEFLSEGAILLRRFGDGQEDTFEATAKGLAQDLPMVVLIDEGSASAAEVLAGAIRDRKRGVLIGQTTFGKGTIQTWHALENGGGLRITVARWLTPSEQWIHETGLDPDYFIPLRAVGGGEVQTDTQLQAAVDLLLGKEVTSITEDSEESRHRSE